MNAIATPMPKRTILGYLSLTLLVWAFLGALAADNRVSILGSLLFSVLGAVALLRVMPVVRDRGLLVVLHVAAIPVALVGPLTDTLPVLLLVGGGLHLAAAGCMWIWTEGRGEVIGRVLSAIAAGAGVGLAAVAIQVAFVSPWVLAWAPIGVTALLIGIRLRTVEGSLAWSPVEGRLALVAISMASGLALWTATTSDPWNARSTSERFLVRYLEQRVALGEHFDQAAFLQTIDWEEKEHPIVVGAGTREVHLFLTPDPLPEKLIRLDVLKQAVADKRITLYLHPLPGKDWARSVAWAGTLIGNESGWVDWARGNAPTNPDFTRNPDPTRNQDSEKALKGSVRALARLGILAGPALVGLASGKNPHPLDPVTLEDVSGSSTNPTTGGTLERKNQAP